MVAVPEVRVAASERFLPEPEARVGSARLAASASRRRVVAIAATAMELLRPESDLMRSIQGVPDVDLLIAGEDLPATSCSVGVLSPEFPDGGVHGGSTVAGDDGGDGHWAELDADEDGGDQGGGDQGGGDEDGDSHGDEVRAEVARLGLTGVRVHRLGLSGPLGPPVEPDLVAALSELVGFDPEPGVYCLAPAPAPGDPARTVINQAVQRIARVYGLPLLRYRCLELSVVGGAAGAGSDPAA
jgi:hypothetical protein